MHAFLYPIRSPLAIPLGDNGLDAVLSAHALAIWLALAPMRRLLAA